MKAKEFKAKVIAATSKSCSLSLKPRNPWGKRLCEVADIVIDNKVPPGDAVLEVPEVKVKVVAASTILNSFIVNPLVAYVVDELVKQGVEPPIWLSGHLPQAKEHNKALFDKYSSLIRLL